MKRKGFLMSCLFVNLMRSRFWAVLKLKLHLEPDKLLHVQPFSCMYCLAGCSSRPSPQRCWSGQSTRTPMAVVTTTTLAPWSPPGKNLRSWQTGKVRVLVTGYVTHSAVQVISGLKDSELVGDGLQLLYTKSPDINDWTLLSVSCAVQSVSVPLTHSAELPTVTHQV